MQSDISKAKAREESPDAMAIRAANMDGTSGEMLGLIAEVCLLPLVLRTHIDNLRCMLNTKLRFARPTPWTLMIY